MNKLLVIVIISLFILIVVLTNKVKQHFGIENNRRAAFEQKLAENKIYSKINKDYKSRGCEFDPTKIENGFYNKLECKDHCNSMDNNKSFGGIMCNEEICKDICDKCNNTQKCRWAQDNKGSIKDKVPKAIKLEREQSNKLIWT